MQINSFLEDSNSKIEKFVYPPLPCLNLDANLSAPKNLLFNAIHLKKGKGLSRKTFMYMHQSAEMKSIDDISSSLSLSENQVLFDLPPEIIDIQVPQVDKMGRFVFNTEEGFVDSVPSEFIEPIRHHHENDHSHAENGHNHGNSHETVEQGATSSATTAAVQRPPVSPNSRNLKSDRAHSNYPVVYSSVYSRPPHSPNLTHAPMMIIAPMNGMNRPIVKEFPDHKFPKIHLFSCPNYIKTVFAPLPTEKPQPLPGLDVLKFNPPKIEMCELCRVPVKDPVEHRESETHKRRALDTNWSQIDKIILETQNNLENWPYKPVRVHSKV